MRVHRLDSDRRVEKWANRLTRYRAMISARCLGYSFSCFRKLDDLHRAEKLDLVQSANYQFPGLFASRLLRIPFVLRMTAYTPVWHEQAQLPLTFDMRLLHWIENLHIRASKFVFAPSRAVAQMVGRSLKIKEPQVIPTPFELEVPRSEWDERPSCELLPDKPFLLFFGRYQPHKGFLVLVQALPTVMEALPELHVVFVGKDALTRDLPSTRAYAEQLLAAYSERVLFLADMHHAQLYPLIAKARLVALPSLVDNLPNACLEAMALGRPVIGTRGASFEELLEDGVSGFLVPIGEVTELAKAIVTAWRRTDLDELGCRARQAAAQFSPEHCIPPLIEFYEKAIISKKSQSPRVIIHEEKN
jgi:glycosyltransferase involved in cell wall biosynthesis